MKMRRLRPVMTVVVGLVFVLSLHGCSSGQSKANDSGRQGSTVTSSEQKKEYAIGDVTFSYPSKWSTADAPGGIYVYPNFGGMLYADKADDMQPIKGEDASIREFMDGLKASDGISITSEKLDRSKLGSDAFVYTTPMDFTHDGQSYKGTLMLISDWPTLYYFMFVVPVDVYEERSNEIDAVLDSVTLENNGKTLTMREASSADALDLNVKDEEQKSNTDVITPEPAPSPEPQPEPEPTPTPEPAPSMTVSQKNAIAKAQSYLNYSAFSAQGLIDQLKFEGFSEEDAIYAVERCGANWDEQAALKAASYLKYSSFSHSSLVDQLIFEGFTREQAEYGVGTTGL